MILILAHFAFASSSNFMRLIFLTKNSIESLLKAEYPVAFEYYQSFFELDLLQKFRVFAVRFARDVISLFSLILAPLAMWRLKINDNLKKFYCNLAVPSFFAIIVFHFTSIFTTSCSEGCDISFSLLPLLGWRFP